MVLGSRKVPRKSPTPGAGSGGFTSGDMCIHAPPACRSQQSPRANMNEGAFSARCLENGYFYLASHQFF